MVLRATEGDYVTETADEIDYEGEFYKILATIPKQEMVGMMSDLKKDTFDASRGPQIGWTADGNVAILTVFTEGTGKMVMDAFKAFMDHECPAANDALVNWTMHQAMLLEMFSHQFSPEIAAQTFFKHEGKTHQGPEYDDDDDG